MECLIVHKDVMCQTCSGCCSPADLAVCEPADSMEVVIWPERSV